MRRSGHAAMAAYGSTGEGNLNKHFTTIAGVAGLVFTAIFLQACATADVAGSLLLEKIFEPDPTVIAVTVKATADVNPDSRDRPSPIKIRMYLLTSTNVFQGSDFYQLKEQDRDLLGNDLKVREEKVLKPSDEVTIEIKLPPEETPEDGKLYFAVMAGYWDLDNAKWRATIAIEPQETSELVIIADRAEVSLKQAD